MKDTTKFVGLDVHKATITIAVAEIGRGSAQHYGQIPNRPDVLRKTLLKIAAVDELVVCYEAGPCGYAIFRDLTKWGIRCEVIAPSLTPIKPGDRIKTDRRDAIKLAEALRNGGLTSVWVPDEEHEALRDLSRARSAARAEVTRCRNRITKLLLRHGICFPGKATAWTVAYRQWLDGVHFENPHQEFVLRETVQALSEAETRLKRIEAALVEAMATSPLAPLWHAYQALRGVEKVTAAVLVTELGPLTRFENPRQLMAFIGMVPQEDSSGPIRHRGPLTKTGNTRVRHVVIETSWHYRYAPKVGRTLRKRHEGLSPEVVAIAWKAQCRLNLRYRRLMARGKPKPKVMAAVGREFLGFLWAIAREVEQQGGTKRTAA